MPWPISATSSSPLGFNLLYSLVLYVIRSVESLQKVLSQSTGLTISSWTRQSLMYLIMMLNPINHFLPKGFHISCPLIFLPVPPSIHNWEPTKTSLSTVELHGVLVASLQWAQWHKVILLAHVPMAEEWASLICHSMLNVLTPSPVAEPTGAGPPLLLL